MMRRASSWLTSMRCGCMNMSGRMPLVPKRRLDGRDIATVNLFWRPVIRFCTPKHCLIPVSRQRLCGFWLPIGMPDRRMERSSDMSMNRAH